MFLLSPFVFHFNERYLNTQTTNLTHVPISYVQKEKESRIKRFCVEMQDLADASNTAITSSIRVAVKVLD